MEIQIDFIIPPVCMMEIEGGVSAYSAGSVQRGEWEADGNWVVCGDFTEGGVAKEATKWVLSGFWSVLREDIAKIGEVDGFVRGAVLEGGGGSANAGSAPLVVGDVRSSDQYVVGNGVQGP